MVGAEGGQAVLSVGAPGSEAMPSTTPKHSKRTHIGDHRLHPETQMMNYGYDPALSEGAVKPPVFLTSTFVFRTAEEGRDFFDDGVGPPGAAGRESAGLVYSRFNHPNSEIVEDRLAVFEGTESCALFSSGMSAISTALLAFVRPGDVVLHSQPLYGGTETLLTKTLLPFGIRAVGLEDGTDEASVRAAAEAGHGQGPRRDDPDRDPRQPDQQRRRHRDGPPRRRRDRQPAGTTARLRLRQHHAGAGVPAPDRAWRRPVALLPDQVCGRPFRPDRRCGPGRAAVMKPVKALRGAIGTQLDPHSCWMLGRSLETLSIRMERADRNARGSRTSCATTRRSPRSTTCRSARRIRAPRASSRRSDRGRLDLLLRHRRRPGRGVPFLNALQIFKLAVSLGGTESLASLPASMTHSGVPVEVRERMGVLDPPSACPSASSTRTT